MIREHAQPCMTHEWSCVIFCIRKWIFNLDNFYPILILYKHPHPFIRDCNRFQSIFQSIFQAFSCLIASCGYHGSILHLEDKQFTDPCVININESPMLVRILWTPYGMLLHSCNIYLLKLFLQCSCYVCYFMHSC